MRREEGFTVLEITVAMVLTLLVVGLALLAYGFADRYRHDFRERVFIQNNVHLLSSMVIEDIYRSASDVAAGDSAITILNGSRGEIVQYVLRPDTVYRNGRPLFTTDDKRIYLSWEVAGNTGFEASPAEEPADRVPGAVAVSITITGARYEMTVSSRVVPRGVRRGRSLLTSSDRSVQRDSQIECRGKEPSFALESSANHESAPQSSRYATECPTPLT